VHSGRKALGVPQDLVTIISTEEDKHITPAVDHISAGTTQLPLPDGVLSVDPQRSEIGFAVKAMWGLQTVRCLRRVRRQP
jgi:hypothetical protein